MKDLTLEEEDICKEDNDGKLAVNKRHNLTLLSKYAKPAFPTQEVHEAFNSVYKMFYAAKHQHMVTRNIDLLAKIV